MTDSIDADTRRPGARRVGAKRLRGQVVVWVAAMMPFFLAIAGLTIDAGQILDARREIQNVADGAARVGVLQIDLIELHKSGKVQLNEDNATSAAQRYMRDQTSGPGWDNPDVKHSPTMIQVTITRHVPTTFLRIINVQSLVTVSATARAEPCVGITGSGTRANGSSC